MGRVGIMPIRLYPREYGDYDPFFDIWDYDSKSDWVCEYEKWKAKQPEYIAFEITSINELLAIIGLGQHRDGLKLKKEVMTFIRVDHFEDCVMITPNENSDLRFINGKLYRKVKNPYQYCKEVIAWET